MISSKAFNCLLGALCAISLYACAAKQTPTPNQAADCHALRLPRDIHDISPSTKKQKLLCLTKTNPASTTHEYALAAAANFQLADGCTDSASKLQYAQAGKNNAHKALEDKKHAPSWIHYYYATNLGLILQEDMLSAITKLDTLVHHLNLAYQFSPEIEAGGPLRVLGMLHYTAPPWPRSIGDLDKAMAFLEEAAKRFPTHPLNHLFLAQIYLGAEEPELRAPALMAFKKAKALFSTKRWKVLRSRWQASINKMEQQFMTLK